MELSPQGWSREGADLWHKPAAGMGRKPVLSFREGCRGVRGTHSQGQGQRGGRREAEKFGEISVSSKAKLRAWKAASMALAEGEGRGARAERTHGQISWS